MVIVTVVGGAIKRTPGVAGRVFGALGTAGINVIAIAMGSSECSISLVVAAADADRRCSACTTSSSSDGLSGAEPGAIDT